MELVYIASRGQQTMMFVNMPSAYKRPNLELRLEKNMRYQTNRTLIEIYGSYR